MTKRIPCLVIAFAASVTTVLHSGQRATNAAEQPNFVIIMTDDMGYSDIGCYGGEIDTPNLDRLAAEGLRFRRFYNHSICCPTRASLLTGLDPHSAGMGRMTNDLGTPSYHGQLNDRCVTIAEVLRDAGYATRMSGKWHVCSTETDENWPLARGFEHLFGTLNGSGSFYAPNFLMRDDARVPAEEINQPDFYYTHAISDNAVAFIEEAPAEKPLFLYVTYTAPHWPLHAFEDDIAKYHDRFDEGWDVLRDRRYRRMIELGVIDSSTRLSPREPGLPSWEEADNKPWQLRRMEVYAAQIDCVDRGIGRITAALEAAGRLEDTLLVFLADNGGCHVEYAPNRKGDYLPDATRDGGEIRAGNLPEIMPGAENTYQSYGRSWANLSNTPFQFYKSYQHEGGTRTPCIVHWPAYVQGGVWTDQPGYVMDLMATAIEAGGALYPETYRDKPILPLDGKSLLPILVGRTRDDDRAIGGEYGGARSLRQGERKIVAHRGKPWELYNLVADPTELDDLAAEQPDRVRAMAAEYHAWADRVGVIEVEANKGLN